MKLVLKEVVRCTHGQREYKGYPPRHVNHTFKISANSTSAQIVADWMEQGLSFRSTTIMVNVHCVQEVKEGVGCRECIQADEASDY